MALFHRLAPIAPPPGSRSYTAAIASVAQLFQARGVYVPLASTLLTKGQFERYSFWRAIKECDKKKVQELLEAKPLTQDQKDKVVSYLEDLDTQPYSVPNLLLAYWSLRLSEYSSRFFLSSFSYHPPSWFIDYQPFSHDLSPWLTYPAILPMGYFGWLGFKLINGEFRAPYQNYDSLNRLIKGWPLEEEEEDKE